MEPQEEVERLNTVYRARRPAQSDADPVYLQRVQTMERSALRGLVAAGLESRLRELSVLDFGCGNARWFGRWLAWGADPALLTGVDVRKDALVGARETFPMCRFQDAVPGSLPFPDATFDVVSQNVVFSSILDPALRQRSASEICRVLKPGGVLLWCDFVFNSPGNPNVRGVPVREAKALFGTLTHVRTERVVLAPPLARRIVPLSWLLAETVETLAPFLRTHVFLTLAKRG